MIKLKMYPAKEGDAFLLNFNSINKNVIIDMGPQGTYCSHIRDDLIKINEQGGSIDLLIVTHVDNDHIIGVIDFIEENGTGNNIIAVKEVWHNSYRHLQFNKKKQELIREERSTLRQICKQNRRNSTKDGISDIAIGQGITLASLLYRFKYNWNHKFSGKAVLAQSETVNISKGLDFKILSPDMNKLDRLSKKWKQKLESEMYDFTLNDDKEFDDAFELFMSQEKDSTRNVMKDIIN
jgi:hypothetical protein